MRNKARQRLDVGFEIKEVTDSGDFSGHASVFGVKDLHDDIVMPGAFTESLQRHKDNGTQPALLWQHNTSEPIGPIKKLEEDDTGLFIEGNLLVKDDPVARRAHAHLKAKSLSGMSIGFRLPGDKAWEFDSDKDALLLHEIDLWEVSLVTFPANTQARVDNVKSLLAVGEMPSPQLVERILRDAGFSRKQAKAVVAKGYPHGLTEDLRDAGHDHEARKSLTAIANIFRQ